MSPLILVIVVFVGIAALVGAVGMALSSGGSEKLEGRLDVLTNRRAARKGDGDDGVQPSVLAKPLDMREGLVERLVNRFTNIGLLFEQADVSLTVPQFIMTTAGVSIAGGALSVALGAPVFSAPLLMGALAAVPFVWLLWKRGARLKKFGAQLPEALELLARALRAGQSLPSGFTMAAKELSDPIAKEFTRVADEQNFGIALEDSLDAMADRVPNLDLRFFCTAVILQRQTGGDLAEILDKLGHLIRERFQIWGQVQALTGEGRLSGAVLLGMPPALFVIMYFLNPEYTMLLINHPMGRQMLAGAIVMQVIGALFIKKIITIKV